MDTEHIHHYTIAVEWEYRLGKEPVYASPAGLDEQGIPTRKVVSKLMCRCGSEKERIVS